MADLQHGLDHFPARAFPCFLYTQPSRERPDLPLVASLPCVDVVLCLFDIIHHPQLCVGTHADLQEESTSVCLCLAGADLFFLHTASQIQAV